MQCMLKQQEKYVYYGIIHCFLEWFQPFAQHEIFIKNVVEGFDPFPVPVDPDSPPRESSRI